MPDRARLPDRRYCETTVFSHNGIAYEMSVGFYADGAIGEVFLEGGKLASAVDIAARDSAIAASIALQHGASIETLRRACLRRPDGLPEGALGAALDCIVRWEASNGSDDAA